MSDPVATGGFTAREAFSLTLTRLSPTRAVLAELVTRVLGDEGPLEGFKDGPLGGLKEGLSWIRLKE